MSLGIKRHTIHTQISSLSYLKIKTRIRELLGIKRNLYISRNKILNQFTELLWQFGLEQHY